MLLYSNQTMLSLSIQKKLSVDPVITDIKMPFQA